MHKNAPMLPSTRNAKDAHEISDASELPYRLVHHQCLWKRKKDTHQPHNQEPHRAREPKQRQASHTPQHHGHVDRAPLRVRTRDRQPIQPRCIEHHRSKSEIAKDPNQHDCAPESFIVILLVLCLAKFLDFLGCLFGDLAHLGFVLRIQVAVVLRDVDVDFAAGLEVGDLEFRGLVVALGAPGDVVGVAEGVDVEDVDVGGGKEEVLEELRASIRRY